MANLRLFILLLFVSAACTCAFTQDPAQTPLVHAYLGNTVTLISETEWESWINQQTDKSFESILKNIGPPAGDNVEKGAVIASPSKSDPDYFYQWSRDAGITMNTVITAYTDQKAKNDTLRELINDYISASKDLQRLDNPSGGFDELKGLGEPKFMVDGSAFTGDWGRPQRDGPAFRAVAMINYCNAGYEYLQVADENNHCNDTYHDVIKNDLDYIAKYWKEDGFDYWEEVNGTHLSTLLIQLKSMKLGSEIANRLNQDNTQYLNTYNDINNYLSKFYDNDKNHLVETLDSSRTGLDAAVLIGAVQAAQQEESSSQYQYNPESDNLINYLYNLVNEMRDLYGINKRRINEFKSHGIGNTTLVGIGIGRYKEDVYDGHGSSQGNPWFLCTCSAAETLYMLANHLSSNTDSLELTDKTRDFYAQFGVTKNLSSSEKEYKQLIQSLKNYADSFMDVIREHQSNDGHLSEQFNKDTGLMQGAYDLTWSYGAFWSASRQRQILNSKMKVMI